MTDGKISIGIEIEDGKVVPARKKIEELGDSAEQTGRKDLKELEQGMDKVDSSASKVTAGIGKIITSLGLMKLATGVFDLIKGSIDKAFNRIDTMEQFDRVMTTITGSTEIANAALEATNEIVKGTGYGLDVAAQSVQNFVTRGLEVDKATATVKGWGDAVAFYGDGSNQTFASVTDALSKMTTKGNVDMEQMNRLFDAGVPALDIYASAVGISTDEVSDQISKGQLSAEDFMDVMNKAFAEGTDGFASIEGAAKEAGATWGATFDNMKAAVARGVTSIIQSIDELLSSNGLPTMRDMVKQFGSLLESGLKQAAEALQTFGQPFIEMIQGIKQAFDGDMSGLQGIIQGIGPRVKEWLQTGLPSLLESGTNMITQIIEGIKGGIGVVSESTLGIINTIVDTLLTSYIQITEAGRELIGSLLLGFVEKAPDLLQSAGDIILTIIQGMLERWPEIFEQGIGLITELIRGIQENIGIIAETAIGIVSAFVAMLVENLPFILEKGLEMVFALVDGIISALPEILAAALEIVMGLLNIITENLPTIVEKGAEMLVNLVQGIASRLPEVAAMALDIIVQFIGRLAENFPDIVSAGVDILTSLIDGLLDMMSGLDATLFEIAGLILSKFTEIDLWEAGKNIIQGLWGGIKSMDSWISGKISGFVSNVVAWFKDPLGIHSPSTLFRDEIGRMLPEGIEVGIRAGESDLKMTTEKMLDTALQPMKARSELNSLIPAMMPTVSQTSLTHVSNYTTVAQQSNVSAIQKLGSTFIEAAMMIASRPIELAIDGKAIVSATAGDMDNELAWMNNRASAALLG